MRKFIDIIAGSDVSTPSQKETVLSLLEAARAYEQMMDSTLNFLEKLGQATDYNKGDFLQVANDIRLAAKKLGNGRNLATWFTRWARAELIASVGYYFATRTRDSQQFGDGSFGSPEAMQIVDKFVKKVVKDYQRQTNGAVIKGGHLSDLARSITSLVGKLEHAKTVDYAPIQNYTFTDQTPETVVDELESLEERWSARQKTNRQLAPREDDKLILKVGDDFAWWLLPRNSCTDEKNAMAHCGNTASPRKGQRILSLRDYVGKDENGKERWVPHATFIWNTDGTLGERKGYNNQKVKPAYFKYVIPLLKQPWIKGLVGGAHASMNDFAISWLPEAQQRELLDANPNLMSVEDRYRLEGLTDELAAHIEAGVRKIGRGWYQLNNFSLDKMSEEDREKLFAHYPVLMPLKQQYEKFGMTQELADFIADGIAREGHHFQYSNQFLLSDLPEEDLFKFWDMHPESMTLRDRYRRFGMNDDTMAEVRDKILAGEKTTEVRAFIDSGITSDDREKLFGTYPETMEPAQYYDRLGVTPEFKQIAITGLTARGATWFTENRLIPTVQFMDHFDRWNIEAANKGENGWARITAEDTDKIFDGHDELLLDMFPHEHMKRHGVTPELAELLRDRIGQNRYHTVTRKHFPLHTLDHEDLDKILDHQPSLTTLKDYYRRNGLTKEFAEFLNDVDNDKNNAGQSEKPEGFSFGTARNHGVPFNIREDLSPEDLETLFKQYPDTMTFSEHYERRGMDKSFLEALAEEWETSHRDLFKEHEFSLDELSAEDRDKLFKKHPEYFPMKEQLVLPAEKFFTNLQAACAHLNDAPWGDEDDIELTDDHRIQIATFSDVDELIDELGGNQIRNYNSEDLETYHMDFDDDPEEMENVLPYALRIKIGEYAAAEYRVAPDEDDEDEVEADEIDPKDWTEVLTALEENDDPLHEALTRATEDGYRMGYEAEVHKSVMHAVENAETEYGTFEFKEATSSDGDTVIAWHGEVKWTMSREEMAEFIDEHTEDGYCSFDSYQQLLKNSHIEMRDEDFHGFDKEAALESFLNEADDDIWEGAPKNPYRKLVSGRQEWLDVSRKDMIAEVEKLLSLMGEKFTGYNFNWERRSKRIEGVIETINDLTDEELTKLFRSKVRNYYVPY
jgi:hypothetical protein